MRNRLDKYNLFWWLDKGFWAIMDKGLYGASNFILNVLLARWISQQSYGAFTVVFSAFVLLLAFYIALFTEPMLVFGPGRYEKRFTEYVGVLLHGHLAFTLLGSLLLIGIYAALSLAGAHALGAAFLGLAIALPFIFYGWLMRQACYIPGNPRLAAIGGGIYMVAIFIGAYLIYINGWLSPFSIFCVMGGASLISGLIIGYKLKIGWLPFGTDRFRLDVLKRHWTYGRWAAAARIPMRAPSNIIFIALPIWGGLAASGALKALMNLIQPMVQTTAALGILLIPRLARLRNQPRMFTLIRIMLLVFAGAGLGYWLILGGFHNTLIAWLYDGQYIQYADLLWILGLQAVLAAVVEVLNAAFRASEKPNWIFWAYATSAAIGLPGSLVLIAFTGLMGAVIGTLLLYLITFIAMLVYYRKLKQNQSDLPANTPVQDNTPQFA